MDTTKAAEFEIPLRARSGKVCGVAIVDAVDADLADHQWRMGHGYAVRWMGERAGSMHRQVLERSLGRPLAVGLFADHINGNKLDNRRSNLREATRAESTLNRGPHGTWRGRVTASSLKGVYARKGSRRRPWRAQIKCDGKQIYLGVFATEPEAAAAYDAAALRLHGSFARLNRTVVAQ